MSITATDLPKIEPNIQSPFCKGNKTLLNGTLGEWTGETTPVYSPLVRSDGGMIQLGYAPLMNETEATLAVNTAYTAYNSGLGYWPTCGVQARIKVVENYVTALLEKRTEIVTLLMWEICKVQDDAEKEFDRTIQYIRDTIAELKKMENSQSSYEVVSGVIGHIRRAPIGVVLCLGPFNYPFNETYATFIPALIMGNTVILKLPNTGVLCHMPTIEILAKCFPPGVVNIISGRGRNTIPAIMRTGYVDVFAFIGTNSAASSIIKDHPAPNRLRICLGLDAKNPAFILPSADLNLSISEVLLGALSYNGQRCTAIKVVFVHESIADTFVSKLVQAVDALIMGLPWQKGAKITPLPEKDKPNYLRQVIEDAVSKGAKVVNPRGNFFSGAWAAPTVLYPVTSEMRVYNEEQFGPIVPIATFKNISEISDYCIQSTFGQQAAIFGTDSKEISTLIDILVNVVSRVNINSQCQRGPDQFPFTGRKNSAAGTLSVHDALRVFSIRAMVACKLTDSNTKLLNDITTTNNSKFLRLDHIF